MLNLKTVIDRLRRTNMEQVMLRSIQRHEAEVVDINTRQLLEGNDSEGNALDPPYRSAKYADFKLSLNPRGVVDLKLTGDFHNSFFVKVDKFPIILDATDPKAPELEAKYGKQIYGIQNKNVPEISQGFLLEEVRAELHSILRV